MDWTWVRGTTKHILWSWHTFYKDQGQQKTMDRRQEGVVLCCTSLDIQWTIQCSKIFWWKALDVWGVGQGEGCFPAWFLLGTCEIHMWMLKFESNWSVLWHICMFLCVVSVSVQHCVMYLVSVLLCAVYGQNTLVLVWQQYSQWFDDSTHNTLVLVRLRWHDPRHPVAPICPSVLRMVAMIIGPMVLVPQKGNGLPVPPIHPH